MTALSELAARLDKPLVPEFAAAALADLKAALAHHYDAKYVDAVAAQIMRQAVTEAHRTAFRSQVFRTYGALDQAMRDNYAIQVWGDEASLHKAQASAMALMTEAVALAEALDGEASGYGFRPAPEIEGVAV